MATVREVLFQTIKNISQRQIAMSFAISKNTVRKYQVAAKNFGFHKNITMIQLEEIAIKVQKSLYSTKGKATVLNMLIPYKEQIALWLKEPCMTHTQIQRLLNEDGLDISQRSINRFISNEFPKLPKSTVHLLTKPGDEAQVDYGYIGFLKDKTGKERKAYVFIMILSHSRHRYVEFVFSQNQLSWAQSHMNAFHFFGGVPNRIILDNLKSGVIKPDFYDPTLNQTYSELSVFYGFAADPAKAYTPQHKGKVERAVRIVKEQLIAGREYNDIDSANRAAKKWCEDDYAKRVCSTTGKTPADCFQNEEKEQLLPLPKGNFDMPEWSVAQVHRDHHVLAKGNFYSVPSRYITQSVSLRIGLKAVSIYAEHSLIKTHPRHLGKGEWITDPCDYDESARYFLDNTPTICKEKAKEIGQATLLMVEHSLKSGTRGGLRKAQKILRLEDKYTGERLESACLRALTYDNYTIESLQKILCKKLDEKETNSFSTQKISSESEGAYIRQGIEYVSTMEVNYEH